MAADHDEIASVKERIARTLYAEGVWCGDCEYESWDACSECRRICHEYAYAVRVELADILNQANEDPPEGWT